jgi:hypothetical protein
VTDGQHYAEVGERDEVGREGRATKRQKSKTERGSPRSGSCPEARSFYMPGQTGARDTKSSHGARKNDREQTSDSEARRAAIG